MIALFEKFDEERSLVKNILMNDRFRFGEEESEKLSKIIFSDSELDTFFNDDSKLSKADKFQLLARIIYNNKYKEK